MLKITAASPENTSEVLAFELENRVHFERWIASRGDAYYQERNVQLSLQQAQAAAHITKQKEYHFLAWLDGEVVGRITLRDVDREHYWKATIGYRFSERHGGKGYATMAIDTVVEFAFQKLGLHRLEAVVILENTPSQRVMQKSGFMQFGHAHSAVLLHGSWHDMLHFECVRQSE